jgi:hypothetical protein
MEDLRKAKLAKEERAEKSRTSYEGEQQDCFDSDKSPRTTDSDQRSIALRSIYLDLSKKFHPDRAQDEEQRKFFNNMMQEINSHYARRDIPGLLHLSRTYGDALPSTFSSSTLNAEIDLLRNEVKELEKSLDHVKREYRKLRKQTPDATAVDRFGKGKTTIDEIEDEAVRDFRHLMHSIEKISNLLAHCSEGKLKVSTCMKDISGIVQSITTTCDYDDEDELFQMMFEQLMEEFGEMPIKSRKGKGNKRP